MIHDGLDPDCDICRNMEDNLGMVHVLKRIADALETIADLMKPRVYFTTDNPNDVERRAD